MKSIKDTHYSVQTLKNRGWTLTSIPRFMPTPDKYVINTYDKSKPRKFYEINRVHRIEETEEFIKVRDDSSKRSKSAQKSTRKFKSKTTSKAPFEFQEKGFFEKHPEYRDVGYRFTEEDQEQLEFCDYLMDKMNLGYRLYEDENEMLIFEWWELHNPSKIYTKFSEGFDPDEVQSIDEIFVDIDAVIFLCKGLVFKKYFSDINNGYRE